MGEIRELGGLIGRAGLALPVADNIVLNVTYESPLHLMRDLRAMGETNVMAAQDRGLMRRDMLARTLEIYADSYSQPDGRIEATRLTCQLRALGIKTTNGKNRCQKISNWMNRVRDA